METTAVLNWERIEAIREALSDDTGEKWLMRYGLQPGKQKHEYSNSSHFLGSDIAYLLTLVDALAKEGLRVA